jgi:hypothetical protein
MGLLLFLSFLLNIVLVVYFLTPFRKVVDDTIRKEEDPPEEPTGFYDDTRGPVSIKKADSFKYADVFDDKGWRNIIGTEPSGILSNVSSRDGL